ncbi:MAG TPA: MATE family efflux transporter [Chitinophagaceae bacterium]|jgi:putative MATE family efflux protein|nr:MATE family efflux transporter [Chitinophagaceae bacterium]
MGATNSLQFEISYRQIIKLALPISFAILIPQFNFITTNIFLGHYNQESLAMAGITGVYYLIFAMIGFGLNNGLQALISRRAGENRPDEIGKIFSQGIYIALIIATIGILLTWFVAPIILQKVIHPDTAKKAINFLNIRICGLPFLYVYQMRNALLVGTNQSKYLVYGTLAEAITNIFFDYSLIFGHFGFPEIGFNGAAIASIIAEFTGMFVIFVLIWRKGISKRFSLFSHFAWNGPIIKKILSISTPLIFQLAVSLISWEFFYILIEHHGQEALAISNIMRNIFGFVGCITWAFAATSAAMVSNIIGQGKHDKVHPLILKIITLSTGASFIICIFINLFPQILLSVFGQNEIFIQHSIPVVRVLTLAMMLMSFSTVWLNAVTGTGNSRITFLIEIVTITLYCIYIYLVLEKFFLSITYGWMSEWLYWISLFILSWLYMRSGKWKTKVI